MCRPVEDLRSLRGSLAADPPFEHRLCSPDSKRRRRDCVKLLDSWLAKTHLIARSNEPILLLLTRYLEEELVRRGNLSLLPDLLARNACCVDFKILVVDLELELLAVSCCGHLSVLHNTSRQEV